MKFEEAFQLIRSGKNVRRTSWPEDEYFGEGGGVRLGISDTDLLAEDWEEVYTRKDFLEDLYYLRSALNRMRAAGIGIRVKRGSDVIPNADEILFRTLPGDGEFQQSVVGTHYLYREDTGWQVH